MCQNHHNFEANIRVYYNKVSITMYVEMHFHHNKPSIHLFLFFFGNLEINYLETQVITVLLYKSNKDSSATYPQTIDQQSNIIYNLPN